jgi:murein DD-endopeptidase MepM/ murein hydrolase activator NlpD
MRNLLLILVLAEPGFAQDVTVSARPDAIYAETISSGIVSMERVFFHIVIENGTKTPIEVQSVRFDIVNSRGAVFSGQYSDVSLMDQFDSSIDRKRIEPTPKQTSRIDTDQRKAISDIFMDFPNGFAGEELVVEVNYKSGGKDESRKTKAALSRDEFFSGRLPFEGTWYVSAEHGYLDPHKRFLAEAFAYDFLEIGPGGKSFQRDGRSNADYFAYGKKVLASKEGTVVSVRNDMPENNPGEANNKAPGGNAVIVDHGNNQFGYYAHLRPGSVLVKPGAHVQAGDVLGEVGNTGDSIEPQLHFHVMSSADPAQSDGIPIMFKNWRARSYDLFPVARQLDVLPRGEFVQP